MVARDHPEIRQQAEDLLGQTQDAYQIAKKLESGAGGIEKKVGEKWTAVAGKLGSTFERAGTMGTQVVDPMLKRIALLAVARYAQSLSSNNPVESYTVPSADALFGNEVEQRAHKRIMERFTGKDDWDSVYTDVIRAPEKAAKESYAKAVESKVVANIATQLNEWMNETTEFAEVVEPLQADLAKQLRDLVNRRPEEADEYVLDDEVLRGLRTRQRHWKRLWRWLVKVKSKADGAPKEADVGHDVDNR